jgi:hypothetical protein
MSETPPNHTLHLTGTKITHHNIMNQATKRSILRWIHIIFAIPIIGYVYSPFDKIPEYATPTRFVFLPALALTGLWMWKGQALRRLFSKGSE